MGGYWVAMILKFLTGMQALGMASGLRTMKRIEEPIRRQVVSLGTLVSALAKAD